MNRLEIIADDIVRGYADQRRSLEPPSNDIFIYNGSSLNGEFNSLRELIHRGLVSRGISCRSITTSAGPERSPEQYNVDVKWYLQKYSES
ncbi:MAG: hypothetical protein AABW82_03820 [Nanoarchaeota archaeon]